MSILIIDNYDSFVYNLARYVAELGYDYLVYRNDQLTLIEIDKLSPSHIIISPGPCTPNEAGISLAVIQAFKHRMPILGVCLGHQAIGAACGGRIIRATYPKHGKAEKIFHDGKGIFSNLPTPLQVARYHSLIVDGKHLPKALRVTARTRQNEIMALQHAVYPLVGVQFHPESVLTEHGHAMLRNFLEMQV